MDSIEDFCPKDSRDWRKWLHKHHKQKQGVWLVMYKKSSPEFNLSWSDAVDQALCYGWIDSTKRPIDENSFKQYFSKRKAKGTWSKINKDKVELLIANGEMTEEGLKSIELAKQNGSWTYLDSVDALEIPQDLLEILNSDQNAMDFFTNLSPSKKKLILFWILNAKRPETRTNRIQQVFNNAMENKMPNGM